MTTQPLAACPKCGSSRAVEVPCPSGPHHAKLVCGECEGFLKWLPKPDAPAGPPPHDLVARCIDRLAPAELRGTEAQVRAAASIRVRLLEEARRAGGSGRVLILKSIADATWFLANRGRPSEHLHWPSESQLAAPR